MARSRIQWTSRAERDLGKILAYLDSYRPSAAADFLERVDGAVQKLAENVELGFPSHRTSDATVRELVLAPHHCILYRLRESTVYVLRVWDGRRNPSEFFVDPPSYE